MATESTVREVMTRTNVMAQSKCMGKSRIIALVQLCVLWIIFTQVKCFIPRAQARTYCTDILAVLRRHCASVQCAQSRQQRHAHVAVGRMRGQRVVVERERVQRRRERAQVPDFDPGGAEDINLHV